MAKKPRQSSQAKPPPKTATVYRLRAECPPDTERLISIIPKGELVRYCGMRVDPCPDTYADIEVRTLTLAGMRALCRRVPDGHVMLQTVQPRPLYTGERNWDLR